MQTPLQQLTIDGITFFAKLEFLQLPTGSLDDRWIFAELESSKSKFKYSKDTKIVVSGSRSLSAAALANQIVKKVYAVIGGDRIRTDSELKLLGADIVHTHPEAHPASPEAPQNLAKRLASDTGSVLLNEPEARRQAYIKFAEELKSQLNNEFDTIIIPVDNDIDPSFNFAEIVRDIVKCDVIAVSVDAEFQVKKVKAQLPGFTSRESVGYVEAAKTARKAMLQGVFGGILSGAAAKIAVERVKTGESKKVCCIFDDSARIYTPTLMNSQWLLDNNLMESAADEKANRFRGASIEDLQLPEAVCIPLTCKVDVALDMMISRDFSQLPVIDNHRKMVGWITLGAIQSNIADGTLTNPAVDEVSSWMYKIKRTGHYKVITPSTSLSELEPFWESNVAAFVTDESGKFPLAVVTKFDVLKFISHRA